MLTMHGLIRRMARLAGDRQWGRAPARCAALRFAAALASRLGPAKVAPYLPVLLAPLYRLTEGAAPAQPDEVGVPVSVMLHLPFDPPPACSRRSSSFMPLYHACASITLWTETSPSTHRRWCRP